MDHRVVAIVLVAAAALAGCTISELPGELSAGGCNNKKDDDDDGVADCQDLDCQAFAACTQAAAVGTDDAALPSQLGDAHVVMPDPGPTHPQPMMDAMTGAEPDAGSNQPGTGADCPAGCPTGQTCRHGNCLNPSVVLVEVWKIVRIEADAPRSLSNNATLYECLDSELTWGCTLNSMQPYSKCACAPDPRVEVWLDQDPEDGGDFAKVGTTDAVLKMDTAAWVDPGFELGLLPKSVVRLKLYDDDDLISEEIFSCDRVAEPVLAGEPLECTQEFPPGASVASTARIRVEFAPMSE